MFVVVPASGGAPGPGPPPPRRCFRTPSPSQGRGGAPLVLRATPRPRSPAAGRTEAAECPFLAAVRDLLFRETEGAFVRGGCGEQGSPRVRHAQPPGSCPKRPSLRQTPGPTPTPVGFRIAQDGGRRWGSPQPPPLTTRGSRHLQHLAGPPICAGLGPPSSPWGVGGPQGKPHGISRVGPSAVTLPHRRVWPWYLLPRAGAGKGRPWACSVTARRQPCPVKGGRVPSQTEQ